MTKFDTTLLGLSGTDLARLAMPKAPDLNSVLFGNDLASRFELITKQASQISDAHKIAITGLTSNFYKLAQVLEQQHKSQILAFQSISERMQSFILAQTKFSKEISNFSLDSNPTLEAIKTLSSYNAFDLYRQTYEEFGGYINPDNVTDEEIEQTIEQNLDLLQEVNKIVIEAENNDVSPGDIPALIFSFLQKCVPNISKRTYGIIVLIFTTVILAYELYSDYSTNHTLSKDVIPQLEQNSVMIEEVKHEEENIHSKVDLIYEKLDNTDSIAMDSNNKLDELQNELKETNDKFDLLYNEMLKQDKQ